MRQAARRRPGAICGGKAMGYRQSSGPMISARSRSFPSMMSDGSPAPSAQSQGSAATWPTRGTWSCRATAPSRPSALCGAPC
eukprot:4801576-Pyramimonas_sp.AAC.1